MNRWSIPALAILCVVAASCTSQDTPAPTTRVAEATENKTVLFDGKDLSKWAYKKDNSEAKWKLMPDDNSMQVEGGDIWTKEKYQDFKLHVEFWCPNTPETVKGQGRGNSGVYLQDRYEVQILDSYGLQSKDDDCGSIYKQKAPDVNACKPPEQWQTYEIEFHAAKFDASGKKTQNPKVSVIQNGQQIQKDVEITGSTGQGAPEGAEAGPIRLQDHHNTVRFRNIWIIPLDQSKEAK